MQSETGLPELKAAMARCRFHFLAVALFSIFVNLLMLTGPLFMLQIYDRVLSSRSEATLVALLVLVTGLFFMMGLLEFIRGRVLARAGARFQSLLDSRVMIAVLRRAVQPAERARPNTAARDLESVRQLLGGPAPFALFDMPWAPIFIAVIFLFHPVLGWISVFGAVILVILTLMNQIRSREPSAESQRATSEADNLGEALRQNAETVQGLGMRESGMNRWLRLRQEALGRQVVASDRTAGYTSSSKALRFYLQSVMLAAGAWLVLQQEISAGMMIAASIMLGRALAPVEQAIGQWGLAQRAARGWASLVELLEKTPPEIDKTALPAPKGFVDVQGVTVAAPGENYPVLRAINFRVEPGTALGVIGPSGAGKTTLAKVLIGIWRPAAGKVRIDGAAMDQWPEDQIGKHLGYLPQEIGLMSGTVAENIARMSEDRNDEEVVVAAQRAGAHELLLALPQGYDTQIGAGGQRLSGGQRQRVALARALYNDPPVLVLDEPNANLDAPGEQALVDAIRDAKSRGKTVIIMAHRPSAIAACDLLLMIDKGVQIDFGPRDEVLQKRTKNYAQLPMGQKPGGPAPAGGITAGLNVPSTTTAAGAAAAPGTSRAIPAPGTTPGSAAAGAGSGAKRAAAGMPPAAQAALARAQSAQSSAPRPSARLAAKPSGTASPAGSAALAAAAGTQTPKNGIETKSASPAAAEAPAPQATPEPDTAPETQATPGKITAGSATGAPSEATPEPDAEPEAAARAAAIGTDEPLVAFAEVQADDRDDPPLLLSSIMKTDAETATEPDETAEFRPRRRFFSIFDPPPEEPEEDGPASDGPDTVEAAIEDTAEDAGPAGATDDERIDPNGASLPAPEASDAKKSMTAEEDASPGANTGAPSGATAGADVSDGTAAPDTTAPNGGSTGASTGASTAPDTPKDPPEDKEKASAETATEATAKTGDKAEDSGAAKKEPATAAGDDSSAGGPGKDAEADTANDTKPTKPAARGSTARKKPARRRSARASGDRS